MKITDFENGPQISYTVARDRVSWGTSLGNGTRKSFSDDIQTESVGEGVPGTEPAILGRRLLGLQEEGDWEVSVWWLCPAWREVFSWGCEESWECAEAAGSKQQMDRWISGLGEKVK